MELKNWLFVIRILNILSAAMMVGFQIWFVIAMLTEDVGFFGFVVRIFAPISIVLLALMIVSAEFKYQKIVEHFKFLQLIPGLIIFNLFMASIMAFQFSTIDSKAAPIVTSALFVAVSVGFSVLICLKPASSDGLLSSD